MQDRATQDIKIMPAALAYPAYPRYTYYQLQWQGSIPGTS